MTLSRFNNVKYADDTLFIEARGENIQDHMVNVVIVRENKGQIINCMKTDYIVASKRKWSRCELWIGRCQH